MSTNRVLSNLKIRTSQILVQAFFLLMLAGAALGILSLRANNMALERVANNQRLGAMLYDAINGYKNVHATLGQAIISFAVNSDQQSYAVSQAWGGITNSALSAQSREQSDGSNQVNRAVSGMDCVVQQNADLVEEAAAAAGSLQEQTARLADAAALFRLGEVKGTHRDVLGAPGDGAACSLANPVAVLQIT